MLYCRLSLKINDLMTLIQFKEQNSPLSFVNCIASAQKRSKSMVLTCVVFKTSHDWIVRFGPIPYFSDNLDNSFFDRPVKLLFP
jgi:hypothetical protein